MAFDDLSIVWLALLVLAFLCLYLIIASVWVRKKNQKRDQYIEDTKNRLYPPILMYLDEDVPLEDVFDVISDKGINYSIFENILYDLAENIEGDQYDRLQKLLKHESLYTYHKNQLESNNELKLIKACRYFSHLISLDRNVVSDVEALLTSGNQLLAHAAASAMMASQDVSDRIIALSTLSVRKKISKMAILELLYEYHRPELDQIDEEARQLRRLIRNELVPEKHLSLLIKGIAELGYLMLADDLYRMFRDEYRYDVTGDLTEAYIFAMGLLNYSEAAPLIRSYIYSEWRHVRKACATALKEFEGEENLKALFNQLYDRDFEVRFLAARGLADFGEKGRSMIDAFISKRGGDIRQIAQSIYSEQLFNDQSLRGEAA